MTEQESIEGIQTAAKRREEAESERKSATADLRRYCAAAKEAGVSITQIAKEAGLSRQGVYDLLAGPA